MKKTYLLLFGFFIMSRLLCVNTEIPAMIRAQATGPQPKQDIASFHYMTAVSNTDFRNPGGTTLVKTYSLSSSGTYVLVQDVSHAATNGNSDAIAITASNVTLDLGGHTFYHGGSGSATTTPNGIFVDKGLSNVTIRNGNVSGFYRGIIVREDSKDIRIQDVAISNCHFRGIQLGTTLASENGWTAENNANNFRVTGCVIADSVVSGCTGTTIGSHGIAVINGTDIIIDNCLSGRNASSAGNAYGVLLSSCSGVVCNNVNASGNESTASSKTAAGFFIDDDITNSTRGRAINLNNCTAVGNYATASSGASYGFGLSSADACYLKGCMSLANMSAMGACAGFSFNDSQDNIVEDCSATKNHGGDAASSVDGFNLTDSTGNLFKRCHSIVSRFGYQGTGGTATNIASGFKIVVSSGSAKYNVLDDCEVLAAGASVVNQNPGGSGAATYSPYGIGVYLDSSTAQNVIKNCRFHSNVSVTSNQGIAVKDESNPSTNILMNNFSYSNKGSSAFQGFNAVYNAGEDVFITSTVTAGRMSDISILYPLQNITIIEPAVTTVGL